MRREELLAYDAFWTGKEDRPGWPVEQHQMKAEATKRAEVFQRSSDLLEDYYGANAEKELVGGSVPATEHSVMCTDQRNARSRRSVGC
jgi:hypothetical protein